MERDISWRGIHHGSYASASKIAEEKKRVIIEAEEHNMSRIPLVKMELKIRLVTHCRHNREETQ